MYQYAEAIDAGRVQLRIEFVLRYKTLDNKAFRRAIE